MAQPLNRNIALTGIPRGGTTVACRLLGQGEGTVALFEPIDMRHLPDARPAALAGIDTFYRDARAQLLRDGTAASKQSDGQLPDNLFAPGDASGVRRLQAGIGQLRLATPPSPGCDLVVKHNAAFAALLPELADHYPTFAIVRHPLAVLACWASVDLPVRQGRIPAGERFDPVLAATLDACGSRLQRQVMVLDWFFERFARHIAPGGVLRYEDIMASQGRVLFDQVGVQGQPDAALEDRNTRDLHDRRIVDGWTRALDSSQGAWRRWYPAEAIHALAQRISTPQPGHVA